MNIGRLNLAKVNVRGVCICTLCLLCAAAIPSSAQTLTTLLNLDWANGSLPSSMVQGFDGNLYGTTQDGGVGFGTVFKVTPEGMLTTLYSFCHQDSCADGAVPQTALALGTDGNFYGTTMQGGNGICYCGTIFRITPSGTLTTLHRFQGTDGANPLSGLIEASNGMFYGTAFGGGSQSLGTVFKMTATGKVTTLYNFCSKPGCADGVNPLGTLMEGTDGNFYGTTEQGGTSGLGTIFQITPVGVFKTLHSFGGADGLFPTAGVVQASGTIYGYGTTSRGGKHGEGDTDSGTILKSDRAGNLTLLHSFCLSSCADGSDPNAGLIQGTDRNFYGTTQFGGFTVCNVSDIGCGTLFKITPAGVLTTLYTFCIRAPCLDGSYPSAGLMQATDGMFYGTTAGGTQNQGTIFSLAVGLAPFVKTVPGSGKVGANITILGTNLTGTTEVSFNGTAASFTVVSGTEITAPVPSGATSGTVAVTTPSTTLTSNVPFQIAK